MMYAYKLPNGLTRLSGKAAYYASVSDAYAELAKVCPLPWSSCPPQVHTLLLTVYDQGTHLLVQFSRMIHC